MRKQIFDRPFLFLLPFLLIYVSVILFFQSELPFGDELRYLGFAQHLIQGYYSPPPPELNLWNGPGFPVYLIPFVATGTALIWIKLANAFLYYLALVVLYQSFRHFLEKRQAFIAIAVTGIYFMPLKSLPHILSEPFTILLFALILKLAISYFEEPRGRKWFLGFLLALALAWLALTKVIFGPVYLATGIFFALLWATTRKPVYQKSLLIMAFSLLLCSPYLLYTYSLTGRIFYWSNAGGMSLYWMSNPAPNEYGEWYNDSLTSPALDSLSQERLRSNHLDDFRLLEKETGLAKDDLFREFAYRNMAAHPEKFFLNWMANWSRMFFNYPVGYRGMTLGTLGNMLANIPVLALLLFSFRISFRKRRQLPDVLRFILSLGALYLFICSFFSAYDRMFYILTPFLAYWIAWSLTHTEWIKLPKSQSSNSQGPFEVQGK